MRIQLATLIALLGVSSALQSSQNRMQKLVHGLSQQTATTTTVTHQCDLAIQQWKSGNVDYKSVYQSGQTNWIDNNFPATSDSLWWDDHYRGKFTKGDYKWRRLLEAYPTATLRGAGDSSNDVSQGSIGTCYYLAGIAAVAEWDSRLEYNFVTKEVNPAGLYAFNVWVRGIPSVVSVDDLVPFSSSGPRFAKQGSDGSLWSPLLEKLWGKLNGNFENTEGGFPHEAFSLLTNAPTAKYNIDTLSADAVWQIVDSADGKNYIMNVWTGGGDDTHVCSLNIVCGHAYTLLDRKVATKKDGSQVRLLKIRNPWRTERQSDGTQSFSGTYNDQASVWTEDPAFAAQVGFTNANDGIVWMTPEEVQSTFIRMHIAEYQNNWNFGWYDYRTPAGQTAAKTQTYTIVNPVAQPVYIKVDLYGSRMYAGGCRSAQSKTSFKLSASGSTTVLASGSQNDREPQGWIYQNNLPAGTYKLVVTPAFQAGDVQDYTVTAYSATKATVADQNGKTNEVGTHDLVGYTPSTAVVAASNGYQFTGNLASDLAGQRNAADTDLSISDWWYQQANKTAYVKATNKVETVQYIIAKRSDYQFIGTFVAWTSDITPQFSFTGGNEKCTQYFDQKKYKWATSCPCTLQPRDGLNECGIAIQDTLPATVSYNVATYTKKF